jgi:hypothetical protein
MTSRILNRLVRACLGATFFVAAASAACAASTAAGRWTEERANAWMKARPYLAGGNYLPSTAINQLEMWQADTFDPATIERELGWARDLGFNTMRVFLHNLPWREDRTGFLQRVDTFLGIADRHGIATLVVIFDSCWDPFPRSGPQRAPKPHVHNSGWVQSPGQELLMNGRAHGELEAYVKDVMTRFKDDKRILGWDLFNEPNNPNVSAYGPVETPYKAEYGLILLKETFTWARQVNPSQPLTAGPWEGDWTPGRQSPINAYMLEQSDVISFHSYDPLEKMRERIELLEKLGRPILCTEFMARPQGSRWETHLPLMKEKNVAAIAWGFIAGKSQTNYPWDSWKKTYTAEPPEWFHDILRADGTAYKPDEIAFLKRTLRQR